MPTLAYWPRFRAYWLALGGFDDPVRHDEAYCGSDGDAGGGPADHAEGRGARTAGNAFGATGSGGTWASAVEVPGLAALNVNGYANVNSVSCTWGGYCTAGGYYTDSGNHGQAFVVSGRGGAWATAAQVPGLAALNTGKEAQVTSVSCTSAGNCAAGGEYLDNRGHARPFVVSERDGVWGTGLQVPGSASLNPHARAMVVSSVSCASAGNCAAGGWYTEGVDRDLVFVVTQRNGVWGTAMRAPGIASLDAGNAFLSSVSCVSAGTCAAGGFYTDASRHSQPFVVDERKGVWGRVMPVPGSAAVNTGGYAGTNSVSCASAGACVAVGWSSGPRRHAFVARERKGTWGKAIPVPGLAALNNGGGSYATSVSCASAGNCAAGGWYKYGARSGHWQAFVVGLVNGRWAKGQAGAGFGHPEHRRAGASSPRCRATRQATAPRAGTTPLAPVSARRSSSASTAGCGARPSRCRAWRP